MNELVLIMKFLVNNSWLLQFMLIIGTPVVEVSTGSV